MLRCKLIINGIEHAFLKEFGCSCARCNEKRKRANTSISLLLLENNLPKLHVLFDLGMHVVDSLCDIPYFKNYNNIRLDWIVLTHWHPDHVLELNRLCETWERHLQREKKPWEPIKIWCRSGTALWLEKNYAYELRNFLELVLSDEYYQPGIVLKKLPLGLRKLDIIPITVSHFPGDINFEDSYMPCCASFVIKYKNNKAVLLWDIDNRNDWIINPSSKEENKTVRLISNAKYLFIECNTWNVESTGHSTFSKIKQYIKALKPKKTFLVHLSGHEDGPGKPGYGWKNHEWENNATKEWKKEKLPGTVHVPEIGYEYEL